MGCLDAIFTKSYSVNKSLFYIELIFYFCSSEWNPREPDQLIDLIERWVPYLPEWIIDNILDQLIYPILYREVDQWNPLTDSIPIHSWLHPWLPLMKDRLEPLYQPIRTKLAQALQNWQPSDSSAKAVLLPWQKVFKQGTWDAFMNKYIVPKLVSTMQQFVIDPRQQILGRKKNLIHIFFCLFNNYFV
jgi:tuftelin-interacting protein 11